jgi:hypothetical protein
MIERRAKGTHRFRSVSSSYRSTLLLPPRVSLRACLLSVASGMPCPSSPFRSTRAISLIGKKGEKKDVTYLQQSHAHPPSAPYNPRNCSARVSPMYSRQCMRIARVKGMKSTVVVLRYLEGDPCLCVLAYQCIQLRTQSPDSTLCTVSSRYRLEQR